MLDQCSGNILSGDAGGYVSVLREVLSLVQEELESMTFAKSSSDYCTQILLFFHKTNFVESSLKSATAEHSREAPL